MTRLYVACEGLTEVEFVTRILKPRLEAVAGGSLSIQAPHLGGHMTYAKLRKFLKTLLHSPSPELRVSTMIDLFKLPGDFPGRQETTNLPPVERIGQLEQNFAADIGDSRFFPYLQLHEFEALLLVDVRELAHQHPKHHTAIAKLAAQLEQEFPDPESVNSIFPPSKRNKRLDGIATVERIGLPRLRERCRHFGQWLHGLERFHSSQDPG